MFFYVDISAITVVGSQQEEANL